MISSTIIAGLLVSSVSVSSWASELSTRDSNLNLSTVILDSANVTGSSNGTLTKFLGIPFAQAPVGNLRFRAPQAFHTYSGAINATFYGPICPQQTVKLPLAVESGLNATIPAVIQNIYKNMSSGQAPPENEDCLTLNVVKPANSSSDGKLPVLVWIFGGGFERGSALAYDYLADSVVMRSIQLGEPIIYVSMNYRVSAWGFLASKEVYQAGEGNMGLQDQRLALQWIQKYIGKFGGDPSKVTIWGQSAGAISSSLQMLAYGGNSSDLFHGAFMQSGSPVPVGNLTGGQVYYDQLLGATNCTGSNQTFSCLQRVPQEQLKAAVDKTPNYFSYEALMLAWTPRADGRFLQDNPQKLTQQGKVMAIPIVSGDVDDEGTVFSLSNTNITTNAQFKRYIEEVWVPAAPDVTLDPLYAYYPEDPSDGSPFNTSDANSITRQYKRIAAFQGDVVFQAPRRFFLESICNKQQVWSYLSKNAKLTPVIGSYHGSDLQAGFFDDYIIRFTNHQNPNNGTEPAWPQYNTSSPLLFTFPSSLIDKTPYLSNDTYRLDQMKYLTNLSFTYPL